MKPVRLGDLRELLQGSAFSAWWSEYARWAGALRDAQRRRDELAAQTAAMAVRSADARRAADAARRGDVAAERATREARLEAERLSREAEERLARARQLAAVADAADRERLEARDRVAALLAEAGEAFGCTPGESFLYWRRAGGERTAWAVALADAVGPGLRVEALGIYAIARAGGAASLEPVRASRPRRARTPGRPREDRHLARRS